MNQQVYLQDGFKMAINKKKFQRVAKLLLSGIFKDFQSICTLKNTTAINYSAQSKTEQTQEILLTRIEYEASKFDGQLIKVGDFMLIGEKQLLTLDVQPDKTIVVYNGLNHQIKKVDVDPADATIIMQIRLT